MRVCSHLGRPKTEEDRAKYSMAPVRERLRELLPDERLDVLENTRFDPRETKNDPAFARELAEGCDLYVNDAFGSAHRAHASTEGGRAPPARLRRPACSKRAGAPRQAARRRRAAVRARLRRREGGGQARRAENLGGRADTVLIGGKMAEQVRVENPLDFAGRAAERRRRGGRLRAGRGGEGRPVRRAARGLARPRHRARDARALRRPDRGARTIFWNGPMGVFEWPRFAEGTKAVAQAVAANEQAFSVVGGADSVRALNELGLADRISVGLDRRRRERSSCSRARSCPGRRRSRRRRAARRRARRQGSRIRGVIVAGNWKMFKGPRETRPPSAASCAGRSKAWRAIVRSARRTCRSRAASTPG